MTTLFFAHYQDIVGGRERRVSIAEGGSVAGLAQELERTYPALVGLLTHGRVAVNAEFAEGDMILEDGDEVAWMPPMSGGVERH